MKKQTNQPSEHYTLATVLTEPKSLRYRLLSLRIKLSVLFERIEWTEVAYFFGCVLLMLLFFVLYGAKSGH